MGLFRRSRVDADEFEQMKQTLESLRDELATERTQRDELQHRVDSVDHANLTLAQQVGPIADLAQDIAALDKRLGELDHDFRPAVEQVSGIQELAGRLDELNDRYQSLAKELTNQLTELSNDIDRLTTERESDTEERTAQEASSSDDDNDDSRSAADQQLIDDIVTGQERLANEQARYQIAFRQDLARLAEQIRQATR